MDKLEKLTSNTQEIVTIAELKKILNKDKLKGYIGFEPSGTVHIGWKICTNKITDFLDCGFDFPFFLRIGTHTLTTNSVETLIK